MATSFDAQARINLDIRSFAQGAQAVTKAGGSMEKIFTNLHSVMSRIPPVEKAMATSLRSSLAVYNQISTAAKNYASAVQALHKAETSGANGAKLMVQAFNLLSSALGKVQGLSEKEYKRVLNTVSIYERLANVLRQLAAAQKAMSSVTQAAIAAQQKDEAAKKKAEQTTLRLAQEEQKLAIQREKLAQSAQRIAQQEQALAAARQRAATATRSLTQGQTTLSGSSFALRNTVGELEQSFQSLFSVLIKVPGAFAAAAISQEQAFAQVARVIGEADAASVGLLSRFQAIAQEAPISFEEVANIGKLGAAIGISAQNLGNFTDTIVKFSLTTGVASEEATIMLGRIAQMQDVPISQIDQLGSAILALGTASAATDQEILRVNSSIATVSNLFGLTAQQTSGLSAALATLQVRPELSRGALTRVFNDLTTSVKGGGDELAKLSKVMGMTDDQVLKLFNNPAMRGDFLLAFIDGLHGATGAGGDVQGVLRELGINAVRDIDVFSRLANNVDVVRESFDRANVEFARGTELNRQSKGIYETTAAEIQNLSDAFKTLLATLGGPIAKAIGTVADSIAWLVGGLAHLGPVVPIVGTLASFALIGAAAWTVYQIALAKTITALIATKELQSRLGVTTLSASTAMGVYRNGLQGTTAAQMAATNTTRQFTNNTRSLSTSLAATQAGMRTYAAASVATSSGLNAMSAATITASRSQQTMFRSSATMQGTLRTLNAASAASALAMSGVSASNRAAVATQSQLAASTRQMAGQGLIATRAMQGMNASVVQSVPVMSTMSNSMTRAATAGASLGAGMTLAGNAGSRAIGTFNNMAGATTRVSAAARVASFAFGPWGLALVALSVIMAPLVSKMFDFRSEAEKISDAAFEAIGGTTALSNAIKADTTAAITAAGGAKQYSAAIKDGSQAALGAIGVYRTITTQKGNLAAADRESAEAARAEAQQRIRAIEATKGSKAELQDQAKGYGSGAEAARRYLGEIAAATSTVEKSTAVLGRNTLAIGENTKQWLVDTAQVVIEQGKLADGSEKSARAMELLSESGLDVGNVLTKSLSNPKGALKDLDDALKSVNITAAESNTVLQGGKGSGARTQFTEDALAAQRLKVTLEALREVVKSGDEDATKQAIVQDLLADAMDDTGNSAASASGKIKLTRESLEDLEMTGEEATDAIGMLATEFAKAGTPMDAFKNAAKSTMGDAANAVDEFSLKTTGGLNAYIKELEKIAKAQRDWAANLIKISATLGPEIAEQFRALGPEAAPAVAELADLSAEELAKLGPRLAEIGGDATSDLAAAIIQNSGKIENASLQTRTAVAAVFDNMIDKAKTSEDFAAVSNQYAELVAQFGALKGIKIDISADDAKAFKSLSDLSLYLDLVGNKKVTPQVAIDIIKAQGDIAKIQAIIAEAVASGKLDAKGKAQLDGVLFQLQLTQLTSSVGELSAGGKFDPKGKGKLDDDEYRAKILALTAFLAGTEGQGLLNPKGKAQLDSEAYRAQMQALANLILGEEAAGKFNADGKGDLDDDEFKALLEALKAAVAAANKGKLDPKGKVSLAGTGEFRSSLGGIVNAAYTAGGRITEALTRRATVTVGYTYVQNNAPPRTMAAANGGWINGPGGPKSDVIPAMLSNGEYVVNAAAARRFGSLLEVINRTGGRGFSGIAKHISDAGLTGGPQPVRLATNTGNTALNAGMVQRAAPESVAAATARMALPAQGPTNVFHINNQYPQAEPTSTTINRSLAYAATISGV